MLVLPLVNPLVGEKVILSVGLLASVAYVSCFDEYNSSHCCLKKIQQWLLFFHKLVVCAGTALWLGVGILGMHTIKILEIILIFSLLFVGMSLESVIKIDSYAPQKILAYPLYLYTLACKLQMQSGYTKVYV